MRSAEEFLKKDFAEQEAPHELTPAQRCRQAAMQYIGLGGKSSGRVRTKLLASPEDFGETIIEATIEGLIKDAYIDDRSIAERILRDRRGRKAEGRPALLKRLLQQGIPEALAEEVLAESDVSSDELFDEWLEAHARRELDRMAELEAYDPDYQASLGRIGRRAQSRGFSADKVLRGVRQHLELRRSND